MFVVLELCVVASGVGLDIKKIGMEEINNLNKINNEKNKIILNYEKNNKIVSFFSSSLLFSSFLFFC